MLEILYGKDEKLRSGWRALIFGLTFIFTAFVIGVSVQVILRATGADTLPGTARFMVINGIFSLLPAIVIGWLCGKYLEGLPFSALGVSPINGWLRNFAAGIVIGGATLLLAVGIGAAFGGLRFSLLEGATTNELLISLVSSFAVFAVAAAFEEVVFRGYLLQTFARSGLAWFAIVLTSVFFAAVHLGNPNAGWISTLNTILAGIWFGVAYLKTRDLWFVWGLHLIWNWMQGSIFGIEVSGLTELSPVTLFREIDTGPQWLTGTTYGIEGGIACTIAIAISIAAILLTSKSEPPAVAGG